MYNTLLNKCVILLTILCLMALSIQTSVSAAAGKTTTNELDSNVEIIKGSKENWKKLKYEDGSTLEKKKH